VVAAGTSELRPSPAHPFLVTSGLRPDSPAGHASGTVALHNTMEQPLAVRVQAVPSVPDLNRLLRVRATAEGKTVFAGTLGGLGTWSRQRFVVPTHERAQLQTRFWLPRDLTHGYQNRAAKVTLQFKLTPAAGAG
jgi:hypothetical protein